MKLFTIPIILFLALALLLSCKNENPRLDAEHKESPSNVEPETKTTEATTPVPPTSTPTPPTPTPTLPASTPVPLASTLNSYFLDENKSYELPRRYGKDKLLYSAMNDEERTEFLLRRARLISVKISGEHYEFSESAIKYIKEYVDVYLRRVGNGSKETWGEDLNYVFARGQKYVPCISRAFRNRRVPPVVGVYIVAIETEYINFRAENSAGACGLFQFIPGTARYYGVAPAERTNVKKMADAAARYMADRINEFGSDTMSVALAIASYNRSPDSVRRDLQEVLNVRGAERERSFWTLITNSNRLDKYFQRENVKYVPKFFAIAIVGETPWAFGLDMKQALSTYETTSPQCPSN